MLKSIEYMKNTNIKHFDQNKLLSLDSNFITDNSKDIPAEFLKFTSNIDRADYIIKLSKLIDINKAIDIEMSIYEYSLIHAMLHNVDKTLIPAIYDDKFTDITMNLDSKSRLGNKTLYSSVIGGIINPKFIAFLSPDQLHPESWAPILNKRKFREKIEDNMLTTDIYKCYKCGERKCKVMEMQMRSADEPATHIVTCLVCYNTFFK